MPNLLLEIFSEEIPARMQARAAADLQRLVGEGLKAGGLGFVGSEADSGPRRLVLHIDGLDARSADIREERKGPRVGAPEKALQGFMRAAGVASLDECETRGDGKGEFYVVIMEKPGRAAGEIIAEVVSDVIRKFPWPKSMRWGDKRLRWVRPLHSVLCLLDGKVVPFEVEGVDSGRTTFGHRRAKDAALRGKPLPVEDFADYKRSLNAANVIVERSQRGKIIREGAIRLAAKEQLDWVEDHGLVDENAGLAEWPVVLAGSFETSFLDVPQEVLITSMKAHQKCFSLREPASGNLANRFLMVANLEADDGGNAIIAGNERVIRARLADAKFFWEADKGRGLDAMLPKLDEITFHEKLGTQGERVERIIGLARELAPIIGADPDKAETAATLCKADLVSETVGEFPELQGLIGRYIALDRGEAPEVANAIAEHYKPAGQGDDAPAAAISIAVALADRIDMLSGFWAIDEKPTGSKDPYGLRRAALGIIRIILENGIRIRFRDLFGTAYFNWRAKLGEAGEHDLNINREEPSSLEEMFRNVEGSGSVDEIGKFKEIAPIFTRLFGDENSLRNFIWERFRVYLRDKGVRYDLIDAQPAQIDLVLTEKRIDALARFLDTDDGANLLAGIKRAQNILRIEEKKDKRSYEGAPSAKLFTEAPEKALAKAIDDVTKEAAAALEEENFEAAMSAMAKLRAPVDAFFDHVTVNADDPALRENRLALLSRIRSANLQVADFSKISG